MKKMKRYDDGGMVDDDDPEAQRVYRGDLTEVSDEERMPRRMAAAPKKASKDAPKKAAKKAPVKASKPESFAEKGRRMVSEKTARGVMPSASDLSGVKMGFRSGGSVKSSASSRADGIAQRGKTRGRVL